MTKLKWITLILPAGLILAACTRATLSGDAMVAQCQAEVAPAGTYEYDVGSSIPIMRAIEDGTPQGAKAFNACIRAKAMDQGMIPMQSVNATTGGACPSGAATLYGGAAYCVGAN